MRRWGYTGVVVAISGDNDSQEFMQAGANAFLLKPLDPCSLTTIIHQNFAMSFDGSSHHKTAPPSTFVPPSVKVHRGESTT